MAESRDNNPETVSEIITKEQNPETIYEIITKEQTKAYEGIVERRGEKPPMKVHLQHEDNCKFTPTFLEQLKEHCPDAKVTTEIGEAGCWEFFINDKIVHSRKLLYGKKFPELDEMIEISKQMDEGRSFMHMYLCTFMEGGEIQLARQDRKITPLPKRIILSCTIQ